MKNTLLFSTGLSPQVVTESLYYHTQINKIKIDEIHIITDATGNKLLKNLFVWYNRFLKEYKIDYEIKFTWNNVHILKDKAKTPLNDLKSIDDNDAAVSQIFNIVENLTRNVNNRLIVSVAGGRKSMSVIIGQALQFYGRKKDILTHVIVDDEIVGCPDFFYPTVNSIIVKFKDKKIDTKNVKIYLDEIPFIRIRGLIDDILPNKNISLTSLVQIAQENIDKNRENIKVLIDCNDLCINNKMINMPAKVKSIYILFLRYAHKHYSIINIENSFIKPDNLLTHKILLEYMDIYRRLYEKPNNTYVVEEENKINNSKSRKNFFTYSWLQETRSKINRLLKDQLNPHEYALCHVQSIGKRFNVKYGITLKANSIIFKNQA